MVSKTFFQEIERSFFPYKERQLSLPLFYQNMMFLSVLLLAPIERINNILPSKRMKPYRITPWHTTILIAAYKYQECDIGPYNEISISIPITIDEQTPIFTGSLRSIPKIPMLYTHSIPVTTEIACDLGVKLAGYPKFVADIEYIEEGNWLSFHCQGDDRSILTLSGQKLDTKKVCRSRLNPISFQRGFLLRSEFLISERNIATSTSSKYVKLELGEHKIAEELRQLNLGRVLRYQYCPFSQAILTPVFESFAA